MTTTTRHTMERCLGRCGLAVAVLLGSVAAGGAEDDVDYLDITIQNMEFRLDNHSLKALSLVLPVGTGLSYMNVDPLITTSGLEGLMPHMVAIKDQEGKELARSLLMNTPAQATFQYTFTQAGLFTYACLIHAAMKGEVIAFEVLADEHAAAH